MDRLPDLKLTEGQRKDMRKLVAKGTVSPDNWKHLNNDDLTESLIALIKDEPGLVSRPVFATSHLSTALYGSYYLPATYLYPAPYHATYLQLLVQQYLRATTVISADTTTSKLLIKLLLKLLLKLLINYF